MKFTCDPPNAIPWNWKIWSSRKAIASFIPQQTHANTTLIGDRLKQIDVENDPLELVSIFFSLRFSALK